ncbi:MAG: hypothetical protein K6B45_02490 [Bacteroidaceae bacterium]|nr:hypothetical protein [Bacteroidaceae bacterium]
MPVNFKGIKTTNNRPYNEKRLLELNDSLQYLPIKQRASVLGTIIEESGGNPLAKSANDTYQGLLQWGNDRYRISSNDPDIELANQLREFRRSINDTIDHKSWTHGGAGSGYNSFRDAYNNFNNQDLPLEDIYRAFSFGYVRPKGKEESYRNRLKVAQQVYDRLLKEENNVSKREKKASAPLFSVNDSINPIEQNFWGTWANLPYKAEGGQIETKRKQWNDLSMTEKSEMMKVAVRNGITNLNDIRQAYNEFADGGGFDEAVGEIVKWNQTDPNTGERNPFYSREYDTYGTVQLPEVEVSTSWTPQGLRNAAARQGRQYMYDAQQQGYNVVGPLLSTLVSAPMDFYPMETLLSGFSKAGSAAQRNKNLAQASDGAAQGNKILKQASMEAPVKEWAEGIPKITRENMHTISDAGWDMAYFDAINSGDIAEAQRLRDLHFQARGNTILLDDVGMPKHFYHGSPNTDIVEFRHVPPRTGGRGTGTEGYYFTPKRSYAERYKAKDLMQDIDTSGGRIYDVYLNAEKVANFPKDYPSNVGVDAFYHMNAPERKILEDSGFDAAELGNVLNNRTGKRPEIVVLEPNQIKLSDVITRDNHGHLIPLSQRDNFNLKDIRYGLTIPIAAGTYTLGNRIENK